MLAFVTEHLLEIFFGLVSASALALCRYLQKQVEKYKDLLEKQKHEDLNEAIQAQLSPIISDIKQLRDEMQMQEEGNKAHLDLIIASYRFRLIQLCRAYLKQEYMTQDQYDQLTEFYKVYHGLGGNGQAKEYYERAIDLPIRNSKQ